MELITQDSYDRRHKQSTIPPALPKDKEIKQEPIQKIQTKQYREQPKQKKQLRILRTTKLDTPT